MPFDLINALSVFQHVMDIFQDYLNQFMVTYLDDILISSPDLDTHEQHVCLVMSRLREHGLYANLLWSLWATLSLPMVFPWIHGKWLQFKNGNLPPG